ncbi:MAG: AAA family ATPase [Chitinivibrionales bacterium]|nr:AAA family ATPase [Chitinivibrionales bacterium]
MKKMVSSECASVPCPVTALCIMGHSNAGKSPLGEYLCYSCSGRSERRHHLDFGEHLRRIARDDLSYGFDAGDRAYVRTVLDGTLLDDAHFYIARRIIEWFLNSRGFNREHDLLLLNGIPRHQRQAEGLARMGVVVGKVICLSCSPEVALERKRLADRGEGHENRRARGDGSIDIFRKKIESFERETLPLRDYYANAGADILYVDVGEKTAPKGMAEQVKDFL